MAAVDYATLVAEDGDIPTADFVTDLPPTNTDETYDQPDPAFVKTAPRPRNAAKYESKMQSILNMALQLTAPHDATVADAAAILQHGNAVANKVGILAAKDDNVAKALDWVTGSTDNPYLDVAIVTVPLLLQILRNHEPILEPAPRGFKIPFLKDKETGQPKRFNLPIKFGIKLGRLRTMTNDPDKLTKWVFENEAVKNKMEKEQIPVAFYKNRR